MLPNFVSITTEHNNERIINIDQIIWIDIYKSPMSIWLYMAAGMGVHKIELSQDEWESINFRFGPIHKAPNDKEVYVA